MPLNERFRLNQNQGILPASKSPAKPEEDSLRTRGEENALLLLTGESKLVPKEGIFPNKLMAGLEEGEHESKQQKTMHRQRLRTFLRKVNAVTTT